MKSSCKNITFLTAILALTIFSSCFKVKEGDLGQFSQKQIELITAGDSVTPMRVWTIDNHADSVLLRKKSKIIIPDTTDEVLMTLIDRMHATVTDSATAGVGIAAPQVGILKKIIWVQRFDKPDEPFEVYLNPAIRQFSKLKQECREGCLSIPDRADTLNSRSYAILLEYETTSGKQITEMVEDFTAVIFQHEVDHLDGILYTDHIMDKTTLNDSVIKPEQQVN